MEKGVAKRLSDLIQSIDTITKNKKGFGYTYLELVKLLDEVRPKITEYGFLLLQSVKPSDRVMSRSVEKPYTIKVDKEVQLTDRSEVITFNAPVYELSSQLVDIESGEVVMYCSMPLYTDDLDPQAIGSSETYMRRYSIFAMFGIKTEDDDGFGASPKAKKKDFKDLKTKEDFEKEINEATKPEVLKALYWNWKDKPFAREISKLSDARKLQLENPDLNVEMPDCA